MFIRSNIRKLPVTTSAHPHFTPGLIIVRVSYWCVDLTY